MSTVALIVSNVRDTCSGSYTHAVLIRGGGVGARLTRHVCVPRIRDTYVFGTNTCYEEEKEKETREIRGLRNAPRASVPSEQ